MYNILRVLNTQHWHRKVHIARDVEVFFLRQRIHQLVGSVFVASRSTRPACYVAVTALATRARYNPRYTLDYFRSTDSTIDSIKKISL